MSSLVYLESQIITPLDAFEFLTGKWETKPAEIGFDYAEIDLAGYRRCDLLDLAHMIARQIDTHRLEAALKDYPVFSPLGGLWNDWDE